MQTAEVILEQDATRQAGVHRARQQVQAAHAVRELKKRIAYEEEKLKPLTALIADVQKIRPLVDALQTDAPATGGGNAKQIAQGALAAIIAYAENMSARVREGLDGTVEKDRVTGAVFMTTKGLRSELAVAESQLAKVAD